MHFFFSSRRRHTRSLRDWSSDVCSSDLDGWYAASLSADVVPVLLEALPRLDGRAQCGVAAGLRQQLERLEGDDWRNWNFARARARRLLRDQEARLHAIDCPTNGS